MEQEEQRALPIQSLRRVPHIYTDTANYEEYLDIFVLFFLGGGT